MTTKKEAIAAWVLVILLIIAAFADTAAPEVPDVPEPPPVIRYAPPSSHPTTVPIHIEPTPYFALLPAPEPTPTSRYAELTTDEIETLARLVYLEARGECAEGQQAVAEVVLNRVAHPRFPDTLDGVIYQENPVQFTPALLIPGTTPTQEQYDAVTAALYGEAVLPDDVVFFSHRAEPGREVWGAIGGHVFSYIYMEGERNE